MLAVIVVGLVVALRHAAMLVVALAIADVGAGVDRCCRAGASGVVIVVLVVSRAVVIEPVAALSLAVVDAVLGWCPQRGRPSHPKHVGRRWCQLAL